MNEMRTYFVARGLYIGLLGAGSVAFGSNALAADNFASFRALWTQDQAPFKIFGNTYYVGTRGLSAILIASDEGHVLLDGALPESAARIAANIRTLGFDPAKVEVIVNSHAHSDHAGGIAELQALTGARVVASTAGATALKMGEGGRDDPQFEYGDSFPAVRNVQVVRDGGAVEAGTVAITARYSPGHTPGSTSWTWTSCVEARCLNMVYADSLSAVSDDSFKFSGDARNPNVLQDFRKTLRMIESLPCDILLAPHPEFVDLWGRLERHAAGERDAFVDASACRRYAETARERFERRLERERAGAEAN